MADSSINVATYFESILRHRLKLDRFTLRRHQRDNNNYTITTPEGHQYWLYWYKFPQIEITRLPNGNLNYGYKAIYRNKIRVHVEHCISLMRNEGIL